MDIDEILLCTITHNNNLEFQYRFVHSFELLTIKKNAHGFQDELFTNNEIMGIK